MTPYDLLLCHQHQSPVVDQGGRGDTPSRHLAPSTLDGVVHEHMATAVKLPLVTAAQQHHLRPQNRGRRVTRHLHQRFDTCDRPDQIRTDQTGPDQIPTP